MKLVHLLHVKFSVDPENKTKIIGKTAKGIVANICLRSPLDSKAVKYFNPRLMHLTRC